MKMKIELDDTLQEAELVLRCSRMTDALSQIYQQVQTLTLQLPEMAFYKQSEVHFLSLSDILFFETDADALSAAVYAHTAGDTYRVRHRLYELENILPSVFIRVSKSAIINSLRIQSITRDITASGLICFQNSHLQVSVSRRYFRTLREKLNGHSGKKA